MKFGIGSLCLKVVTQISLWFILVPTTTTQSSNQTLSILLQKILVKDIKCRSHNTTLIWNFLILHIQ